MAAKGVIEYANLSVTFTAAANPKDVTGLLDRPQLVLPLFFEEGRQLYRGTSFFFYNSKAIELAPEVYAIAFEFVKVRDLKSYQRFVDGQVVEKRRVLPDDACSGVGILVLNDHRVAYVGKTPFAPTLEQLASHLQRGVRRLRRETIEGEVAKAERSIREQVRNSWNRRIPLPVVEIVRFVDKRALEQAIDDFKVLKRVQLTVIAPNPDEYDGPNGLLKELRAARQRTGATKAVVTEVNEKGLNRDAVKRDLAPIASDDHTRVKMDGIDQANRKLTRDDDQLAARDPADFGISDAESTSPHLWAKMKPALASMRQPLEDLKGKARKAFDALRSGLWFL